MAANLTSQSVSSIEDSIETGIPGFLAGILIPHGVCTVFILARVWSRLFLLRKWFLDDTLIVAAWLSSTAVCVMYSFATQTPDIQDAIVLSSSGSDSSDSDGTEDTDAIQTYVMRTYLGLIFYQFCLCVTKLSILAFYVRMFKSRHVERRLAWATVVFVLLYSIPLLLMTGFQCHPLSGQFLGSSTTMKCFQFIPLLIASAALHTATDGWLILMVAPCVAQLDLPRRQKVALGVVLSLSIFVIAASMVRLQLSLHANYRPSGAGVQVWSTLMFFVMTILECDIALICASAPTLRPVLARLLPRLGMGDPASRTSGTGAQGDNSANLTAVSYHGYPWTQPSSPQARSKNASMPEGLDRCGGSSSGGQSVGEKNTSSSTVDAKAAALAQQAVRPPPPAHALPRRTPTAMSIRSFISNLAPRRRSAVLSTRHTDYSVLEESDDEHVSLASKPSLLGFERYYSEQQRADDNDKKKTGKGGQHRLSQGPWGNNSQESFVMGMNDPASPHRLSPSRLTPLSPMSALSGTTFADNTGAEGSGAGRGALDLEERVRDI